MPALDLPMEMLLFDESDTAPDWDRGSTLLKDSLAAHLRRELKNRRVRVHTLLREFVHTLGLKCV